MTAFLRAAGAPWILLARTLAAVRENGLSFRETVVQTYEFANRSVWLIGSGLAFFGAVMVTIANVEARKITGNLSILGPAYFELLVREFAPIICGLLCAARVGASHSAELSAMTVGEQVEALEMSAGDPLADLVGPRLVAGLLGLPVLTVLGTVAAAAAAVVTAYGFGADGREFIDARFVTATDLACAAVKSLGCGLYIPLTAAWTGLRARGGASAVGSATTDGVVSACFGVLLIDFLVAQAFGVARL